MVKQPLPVSSSSVCLCLFSSYKDTSQIELRAHPTSLTKLDFVCEDPIFIKGQQTQPQAFCLPGPAAALSYFHTKSAGNSRTTRTSTSVGSALEDKEDSR